MYVEHIVHWYEINRPGDIGNSRRKWPEHRDHDEYWALCPYHTDTHVGSFSFSMYGYNCFACGNHGSLSDLAQKLGIDSDIPYEPPPPRPPKPPEPPPRWIGIDYDKTYLPLPDVALRAYHERGLLDETIARWKLGYGVLPRFTTRCDRPRLIVPCFQDGQLVGLRGRWLEPHTHYDSDPKVQADVLCEKWLPAKGSKTILYGAENLVANSKVIIVEGPLDVITIMQQQPDVVCVSGTSGAGTWWPEWTLRIAEAHPSRCLVWFDNEDAPIRKAPQIANELLALGVHACVFHWPPGTPVHADPADYILSTR